jgi:C-terminal processing protease CtpA/Prc
VSNYYDEALINSGNLLKGDVLAQIGKQEVSDIVNRMLPLMPASNRLGKLRNIANNLLRTKDTLVDLTILRNGIRIKTNVRCFPKNKINFRQFLSKDSCFRIISPGIAYLKLSGIRNEYLDKLAPIFLRLKSLIIDARGYPSEFVLFSLARYLFPGPRKFATISVASMQRPGLFTVQDTMKAGENNKDYFKGWVFILVNEFTQSSAEFHVMAFQTAPNVVTMGTQSAGADGNISNVVLPGGITTNISGIGVYYPTGRETQRIGVIVDKTVDCTVQGIRENRDEILEEAVKISKQKFKN